MKYWVIRFSSRVRMLGFVSECVHLQYTIQIEPVHAIVKVIYKDGMAGVEMDKIAGRFGAVATSELTSVPELLRV